MGLIDHKCDSCAEVVGVLFPIVMLVEMPTGGEQMVQRYYCIECSKTIVSEAEEAEDDDDNEEEARLYICGCIYRPYLEGTLTLWTLSHKCGKHWKDDTVKEETYKCGCRIVRMRALYAYRKTCEEHEV